MSDMDDAAYYEAVYRNLVAYLGEQYRADDLGVARLCDQTIDRSGRLLGEVRTAARQSKPKTRRHT